MMTPLALAAIFLLLAALASATMLVQDVDAGRLRQRIQSVHARTTEQAPVVERAPAIRSAARRGKQIERLMRLLQFNPAIPQQNIIPWRLVIATALGVALAGFFYGRALIGWPLAALIMPVEAFFTAWCIFGWQRARYQKALLEQIPEVMALICRAVGSGIPLTEALRSVAREADSPSREEFAGVASEVAIGQPLEGALWKLHERAGLPEYAFFAVTIGLQAQTGGSLVETLQNLQDLVRKRVALSKRGKALAAEARMSATILSALPFVAAAGLAFLRPGFLDFFFYTPTGNRLLLIGFGLLGIGTLVMRQLIRRSLAP
jgi:tight adherence protein B